MIDPVSFKVPSAYTKIECLDPHAPPSRRYIIITEWTGRRSRPKPTARNQRPSIWTRRPYPGAGQWWLEMCLGPRFGAVLGRHPATCSCTTPRLSGHGHRCCSDITSIRSAAIIAAPEPITITAQTARPAHIPEHKRKGFDGFHGNHSAHFCGRNFTPGFEPHLWPQNWVRSRGQKHDWVLGSLVFGVRL